MKLDGSYTFEATPAIVWQALFDPQVLASTLPGCDKLTREGDQFKGDINVKMGPVQGKFQGKVDVLDVKELDSYKMVIDGRGPAGFVKATAQIGLFPAGTGTRLAYDSDVQVGGKVASVGQRLIDASARAIVKQSLEGLNQQIKALAARSAPVAPAPAPAPAVLDAGVPKDVPDAIVQTPAGRVAPAPVAPAAVAHAAAPVAPSNAAPRNVAVPDAAPVDPVAAAPATPGNPAPRGPSQAAFALGVAKEVTKELLPVRTIAIVVAVVLLIWLVYRSVSAG
jgi:carbon monoxide dehydrogenase subunit G